MQARIAFEPVHHWLASPESWAAIENCAVNVKVVSSTPLQAGEPIEFKEYPKTLTGLPVIVSSYANPRELALFGKDGKLLIVVPVEI